MPQHREDPQEIPLLFQKRVLHLAQKRGEGHVRSGRPGVLPPAGRATAEMKAEIVARISDGHEPVMDVSIATGCSRATPYKWLRQCRGNGVIGLMGKEKTKRKKAGGEPSAELSKRLDEMQMQIGVPMETIDVLKKTRASAKSR